MNKNFVISILILSGFFGFSQNKETAKKWYSTVEIDLVFPNQKTYFYNDSNNTMIFTDLGVNGFLLDSYGVQYSYNYLLFSKLSFGAVAGFQTQTKPTYTMFKLGFNLKYFFVDSNNIYVYLQDANNFSTNKSNFKSGNNFRFGLGFPFLKRVKYNLNLNLFFEQNYFKLDGSKPLLSLADEIPRTLTLHSFGISFGVRF